MPQLGESKYIDELNAEAQKSFGKNYVDLTESQRLTIIGRVTGRRLYKPRDPSTSPAALTEKKIKDFIKQFKKDNKRRPMIAEISEGTGSHHSQITKYATVGKDYLTPSESNKIKDSAIEAADLTAPQKKWYAANKDYLFLDKNNKWKKGQDDFMSLNTNDRAKVRQQYKNRATTGLNHQWVKAAANEEKLKKFLQTELDKVKPGENLVINSQRNEYLKKIKAPDLTQKSLKEIFDSFGGRFVFKNQKLLEIPGMEKEIIELAKTKGPKDIIKTLIDEKKIPPQEISGTQKYDLKAMNQVLNQLLKEKKISKIMPPDPTQGPKDQLVKKFIKANPEMESAHEIAKRIADNENIKMSPNFVKAAIKRLGLEKEFKSLHARIYPQVASLDKILKKNANYIKSAANPSEKFRFLSKEYAKATKQPLDKAAGQLKNRLEKLGSLYQGTSDQRYETKLYQGIKKPIGFNDNFAAHLIDIASRSKQALNNSAIARMLGLPASQIQLIDDMAKVGSGLGVKVAGDHTDIKALMKNFPEYKKNFLRIQLISDKLNDYKGKKFDSKIIAQAARAIPGSPEVQADALKEVTKIQKEFKELTGADIGGFDVKDGRVFLNEKSMIPRINEFKNPINQIIKQGIINLETTSAPDDDPVKFTNIVDRLLKNAGSAAQRLNIFKKYQGTKAIQGSKYLNSLGKIPRFGPIVKGILLGGAGVVGMTTLANAGETNQVKQPVVEPQENLKYNSTLGSIVNTKTEEPADQNQVFEWIKENPVKTVAGTSIGFSAQEIPGAYKKARELGRGRTRSALGITGALKPVLTTFGTPAMTALFEVPFAAKRLEEGESMTEVLTDPLGPALGLTFMEPLSRGAGVIRGGEAGIMGGIKRAFNPLDFSNLGKARPGLTSAILRMGLSPLAIRAISKLGPWGMVAGAGLAGLDQYRKYQNEEGMLYNLLNE